MNEPKTVFEEIVEHSYKAENHNSDEIVINSKQVVDIIMKELALKLEKELDLQKNNLTKSF